MSLTSRAPLSVQHRLNWISRTAGFIFATLAAITPLTAAHAATPIKLSGLLQPGDRVTRVAVSTPTNPATARAVCAVNRAAPGTTLELWSAPVAGGTPVNLTGLIVAGGAYGGEFKVSSNGSHVVFAAAKNTPGQLELFSVPIAGGATVNLSGTLVSGGDVRDYEISADSSKVVFSANKTNVNRAELYSVPIGGGAQTPLSSALVNDGIVTDLSIAENSLTVIFRFNRIAGNTFELYRAPINGSTPPVNISGVLPSDFIIFATSFKISPNSQWLLFIANQRNTELAELYSVSLLNNVRVKLSGPIVSGGGVTGFRISSDSTLAVFRVDPSTVGMFELFSVPIEGGTAPVNLSSVSTAGRTVATAFEVSPDSTRVVFTSNRDTASPTSYHLYRTSVSGGSPRRLTDPFPITGRGVESLTISPDSAYISFIAQLEASGVRGVYATRMEVAAPVKLSGVMQPPMTIRIKTVISPDSKWVFFLSDKDTPSLPDLYATPITGGTPTKLSGPTVPGGEVVEDATTVSGISADSSRVVFKAIKDVYAGLGTVDLYSVSLRASGALLDIDGDGQVLATTDLLMVTRYQLGIRGAALIANALGGTATRTTFEAIEDYLRRVMEAPSPL